MRCLGVKPIALQVCEMMKEVPLFPLPEVVLPQGRISLRVFEPGLLSMVKSSLRNDRDFGVCLISKGVDTGQPAHPYPIGTLSRIIDFDIDDSRLLTVIVAGIQQFRIERVKETETGVQIGVVELLPTETASPLPREYSELSELLQRVLESTLSNQNYTENNLQDSVWVSNRLIELLPITADSRHDLIDLGSPLERLSELQRLVNNWSGDTSISETVRWTPMNFGHH